MPTRTLAALAEKAIAEGLDPRTPALAISRATRPDQAVVTAPIAELPEWLAQAGLPGPVLVLIGRALKSRSKTSTAADVRTAAAQ
jgi:uroporphyrin-III C-methyltransferase/precorrin-2 dehydrogenase/sirohydrochlorin ferrochelatase